MVSGGTDDELGSVCDNVQPEAVSRRGDFELETGKILH